MFAKLLKYEFKSLKKTVFIGGLAAILAGALGGLMLYFLLIQTDIMNDQEVLETVMSILLGGIYIGIFAYAVAPSIVMLYRFYTHHFTDEGYLTFTVPATTHQILMASIVNILICSIIVVLFSAIAFGLTMVPVLMQTDLSSYEINSFIEYITEYISEFGTGTVLANILSFISSIVYSLIMPLFCITLGCLIAKKHKILCSFAVGYGVSMVTSMVTGIADVTVLLTEYESDAAYLTAYNISVLVPALLYLALGIGGYFLMHHLIKNKLNI